MGKTIRFVVFFKPYGVLSQFTGGSAPEETLSVFGLPPHLYAAGRLDKDSEGLLLLTNDGEFINQLLTPERAHPRTYWVQVEGVPDKSALGRLASGVEIGDYKTRKSQVRPLSFDPPLEPRDPPVRFRKNIPTSWLEMTLHEGKNRQVRRMTAAVGFPTLRLVRVKIGKFSLIESLTDEEENQEREKMGAGFKLRLKPGEWREVERNDII